jgi:hypothetical protein
VSFTVKKSPPLKFLLIVLLSLSSAGCINYGQETYLNEDMSGRVELCFSLNVREGLRAFAEEMKAEPEAKQLMVDLADKAAINFKINVKEEDFLQMFNAGAIKRKEYRKVERDGMAYFYFTAEFDDIRKLYEGKKRVTVTEGEDSLVTYTEYFEPLEDEKKKDKGDGKEKGLFKGFNFRYVLHMPRDIVSANTDRIDKNTATWELPLDGIVDDKDFHITASIKGRKGFLRWPVNFKRR